MATKKAAAPKKKIVSGFCNAFGKKPQHEGTKPVSASGAPMPVCTDWQDCACSCHTQITEMYKMIDEPRPEPEQTVDHLEWIRAQRHQFRAPSDVPTGDPSIRLHAGGADVPPDPERTVAAPETDALAPSRGTPPAVPVMRATMIPTFRPTPTGRRPAGQLEHDVLSVCEEFTRDVYEWEQCTPKLVAERIGVIYQMEPPSTGAINAVWDRWEKLGFAEQGRKPSRFLRFINNPTDPSAELQRMKDQAARDKKRNQAELRRGSLRPRSR